MAILGAAIVYWVLMSNFLYSTVVFVHGEDLQMYICICNFHNTNNIVTFVQALLSEQECIFILFQTISTVSTLAMLLLTTASTAQATKLSAPPISTTTPSCQRKFFVFFYKSFFL